MKIIHALIVLLLTIMPAMADGIYKRSTDAGYNESYRKLYTALEENRFFVINEINIGKNLAGFSGRWGDDYNRNNIEELQVMIICNGWYANQVSNLDPDMLALCPLHVTLIRHDNKTTALFARPTTFAGNSKALAILKEVEDSVIGAIESALK